MIVPAEKSRPGGFRRAGVTLIEMLIVLALIGLMVSVSYPSVSAGVDNLRLSSSGDSVANFLTLAMNRAERREQAIEVTIDRARGVMKARSTGPGFERRIEMATGVRIEEVLPAPSSEEVEQRSFVIYPGGTPPRIGVVLVNARGARRTVRINPITGVPEIEKSAPR
jgi:type IV fimbrial biogenesis protein FimT